MPIFEKKKEKKAYIPTFSEVTGVRQFEAETQERFSDLVNREFIVLDYTKLQSRFNPDKEYVVIFAKFPNNQTFTTTTGSEVIMRQLDQIHERLPVKVTLKKVKRYFTFS